jgi:protein-L-isoaspartate O-methyltransferase
MIPGTRGYADQAAALVEQYESIPFEYKYRAEPDLLPPPPGDVLDVGAGTGADAAWLASRGHRVLAVEPTAPLGHAGIARLPMNRHRRCRTRNFDMSRLRPTRFS